MAVLYIQQEDWYERVIGIVTSRFIETYYRLTLIFTKSGDKLEVFASSVKGFSLLSFLQ